MPQPRGWASGLGGRWGCVAACALVQWLPSFCRVCTRRSGCVLKCVLVPGTGAWRTSSAVQNTEPWCWLCWGSCFGFLLLFGGWSPAVACLLEFESLTWGMKGFVSSRSHTGKEKESLLHSCCGLIASFVYAELGKSPLSPNQEAIISVQTHHSILCPLFGGDLFYSQSWPHSLPFRCPYLSNSIRYLKA